MGGGIPIAVGAALSQKLRGDPHMTVCFFGDGASNEGSFHEAVNLAAVWKLPVLFVCVNNQYAMSTPIPRQMNIRDLSQRAVAYGMKGVTMDGNDAIAIYRATLEAKEYVKANGPMLLVLNTYRHMGHSKSDANVYRTKDEIEQWKKKDPIPRMRAALLGGKLFTAAELDAMEAQAKSDVEAAVRFAEQSPNPKVENVLDDVYAPSPRAVDRESAMREITYAEAIREAMCEEMRRDPRVFILGEDIGVYGGAFGVTKGMLAEFGEERVRDTPLSECAIAGAAVGRPR